MIQEERSRWDHSDDPEYGQRLLAWIFRRHIWQLLASMLLGAFIFMAASLFIAPRFGTSASIMINKGGGGGGGLLSGLSLLGGPTGAIVDEMLVLESREIGLQVIDELGLQVEIYDPQGPDAALERVMGRLGRGSSRGQSRMDVYSRLRISDISVSDDMLKSEEMWISADADGNWKLGDKSGANGEPVEGKHISFTPQFGGSHRAGYRYLLKVLPDAEAWQLYKESLTVAQAAEDASIVRVRFTSYNPLLAKQAVDLIVSKYLELNRSKTFDEFDNMLNFLKSQSDEAQQRIDELDQQVQQVQADTGLYNPIAQGELTVQRMSQIATERTQNRIAIRQIDNVLRAMDSTTPQEFYEIIQAPATPLELENALVLKLSGLITNLENHLSNKTEKHPDVINLKNQIDVVVSQIGDSLRSNRESLVLADGELAGDYGMLTSELEDMPAANSDLSMLNAELRSLREIMEVLKKQETETRIAKVSASMDVSLMDEAPMPAKREKPAIGRNTALGGFAGLIFWLLVLLFRESSGNRFRTLKEIRSEVGLPVLATLPGRRHRRRWQAPQPDPVLAAGLAELLFARGTKLGLAFLPGAAPSWDPAAYLAIVDNVKLLDALPGEGLAGRGVSIGGDGSQPARLAADLQATDGARYAADALQSGRVAVLLDSPLRWNFEPELAARLDSIVLCVPQGSCSSEELTRVRIQLESMGFSCRGVLVSNWSEGRDIYGAEELNYVALSGRAAGRA